MNTAETLAAIIAPAVCYMTTAAIIAHAALRMERRFRLVAPPKEQPKADDKADQSEPSASITDLMTRTGT